MKNQYVGDVNDFLKYAFLNALACEPFEVTVVWMLTEGDDRTDGMRLGYLSRAEIFRNTDANVFDGLHRLVDSGLRSVKAVQEYNIVPRARFVADKLVDSSAGRSAYMSRARDVAAGTPIIFFDPDNGVEVRSVRKGRRHSAKYLYLDEVIAAYGSGHSLVIYQHFPRQQRTLFLRELADRLIEVTDARQVVALICSHVAFLVIPQREMESELATRVDSFATRAQHLGVRTARFPRSQEIAFANTWSNTPS